LAAEVGVQWLVNDFSIRPWFATDNSLITRELTSVAISSQRLGFDIWWHGGPALNIFGMEVKAAILLFGVSENVTLSATGADEKELDRPIIKSVEYTAAYAGLGLGISW